MGRDRVVLIQSSLARGPTRCRHLVFAVMPQLSASRTQDSTAPGRVGKASCLSSLLCKFSPLVSFLLPYCPPLSRHGRATWLDFKVLRQLFSFLTYSGSALSWGSGGWARNTGTPVHRSAGSSGHTLGCAHDHTELEQV